MIERLIANRTISGTRKKSTLVDLITK